MQVKHTSCSRLCLADEPAVSLKKLVDEARRHEASGPIGSALTSMRFDVKSSPPSLPPSSSLLSHFPFHHVHLSKCCGPCFF